MTISLEPGSQKHRLYLSQLALYLRHSRQILTAWDHYSARHSDPETFQPHDEDAYGLRQQQRDAHTLAAFGRVYYHADELVYVAEQQLAQLSVSDRTRRFAWQVQELHEATECLYAVYDDWLTVRAALPESARHGGVRGTARRELRGSMALPGPVGDPRPGPLRRQRAGRTAVEGSRTHGGRRPSGPRRCCRGAAVSAVTECIEQTLISPRYLAGSGDPAWVTVPLRRACGWSTAGDPLVPRVILASPDQLAQLRIAPDPDPAEP